MPIDISTFIQSDIPLTEEEKQILIECIPVQNFPKGTILLKEGQVARNGYYNIKGCVRSYYLVDGEEKTTQFYTELQSIASHTSYVNQTPANHYLACVEDCVLAVLNYEKEKELCRRFPRFESLCRVALEEDFGKHQEMLSTYITSNPEQRYLHLLKNRPELLHRVPQHQLASYLGVKPESLSRIRKRIALKDQH